jgi:hypothetical protein
MIFLLLLLSLPLQAMEPVLNHNDDQAGKIIDVFLNGNGDQLKEAVVPKLSQKIAVARVEQPLVMARMPNIVTNRLVENNVLIMRAERSPSTEEVFNFAERMLATSLHEVIEEKELELKSSERKKCCMGVIAIAGAAGTIAATIAAILTSCH